MNQFAKTLVAGAVLAATGAAHAEISGNVSMASDYVWRGFSQTDNQMAISGGFDYAHESGFYLGTWGSNVNFGPSDPSMEVDVYGGFAGEMGAIGYDLGVIGYLYPSADDLNTTEFYLGGSYAFTDAVSANAKYYYTDDYFGAGESAWRVEGGLDIGLPSDFGLSLLVGQNDGDAFDGGSDYVDYSVGLTKSMWDLDFGLTYTDSDADGCGNLCDDTVIFSVGKSL
jgi:uncharacterized protein (TIGR02001 family)